LSISQSDFEIHFSTAFYFFDKIWCSQSTIEIDGIEKVLKEKKTSTLKDITFNFQNDEENCDPGFRLALKTPVPRTLGFKSRLCVKVDLNL